MVIILILWFWYFYRYIFLVLVYSVLFRGACVSPHTTTTHHTKLHYTTTKHKHTNTHRHTLTKTQTHIHQHKNHAFSIASPAGSHNLAIRELLFLFLILNVICVLHSLYCTCLLCICLYTYMYTHIVVVFGILMEFVLYATVIAGATKTHQHNESYSLCRRVMMTTTATSSSSFVPELLYCFLSATKDCIRLNCGYCCHQQFSIVAADG